MFDLPTFPPFAVTYLYFRSQSPRSTSRHCAPSTHSTVQTTFNPGAYTRHSCTGLRPSPHSRHSPLGCPRYVRFLKNLIPFLSDTLLYRQWTPQSPLPPNCPRHPAHVQRQQESSHDPRRIPNFLPPCEPYYFAVATSPRRRERHDFQPEQ